MSTRGKTPTQRGRAPAPTSADDNAFSDDRPTQQFERGHHGAGLESKTDPNARDRRSSARTKVDAPMRAISMKTPSDPNAPPPNKLEREMPHIQLRAMSEMSRANQPLDLGNLAPPYDPAQARARTVRDYAMWGSLAVALAIVIGVAVWVVAT